MGISFKDLKRNSATSMEKLNKELEKLNAPKQSYEDDRMWKATQDSSGNGYAIIRFLPPPGDETVPFVRIWSHGFQGPGGWYVENSRTTLGYDEKDPVAELNHTLWNSGLDSDKETARGQKRQLSYYSNIYVVKDPANPENEGKVFLFRYGKKIFDKLNDLMNPQFEDEQPINPFDLWEGANFKLKITKVAGYANYDKSEFESVGPLLDDDGALEVVWKSEHSLQELIAPSNFKPYDVLKARLDKVLGSGGSASKMSEDDIPDFEPKKEAAAPKFKERAPVSQVEDDDDDDGLDFFKKMVDDD